MSDFNSLTASELGDMIGQGEIDPVELTKHFLSRIETSPIGKKVYSTVTSQLALEQAKDAKKRAISGRRLSKNILLILQEINLNLWIIKK